MTYRAMSYSAVIVDEFDAFEAGWYQLVVVPAGTDVVVQVESDHGKWSVRCCERGPQNELDFGAVSSGTWTGKSGVWAFGVPGVARAGMLVWCPGGARVGVSAVIAEVRYCGPERPEFWFQLL